MLGNAGYLLFDIMALFESYLSLWTYKAKGTSDVSHVNMSKLDIDKTYRAEKIKGWILASNFACESNTMRKNMYLVAPWSHWYQLWIRRKFADMI